MNGRLRSLAIWLIVPICVLAVFGRLVLHPSSLIVDGERPSQDHALPADSVAVGNDLTRLFLPHHARIADAVGRTGLIPGWDPAGFGGRPFVGNPQAGLWYPPTWIAWRFWIPSVLGWLTIAHLIFGGWGVEILARSQNLSRWASAVAGSVWATSPYVIAQTYEGHYPHLWSASYAPWAIWSALGWSRDGVRWKVLPGLLAMGALTGHSQESYYVWVVLAGWVGWNGLIRVASSWRRKDLVIAHLSGATRVSQVVFLTAGLLAIEIIPDVMARSHVVTMFRPTAVDGARYHVELANLAQLLSPFALGRPTNYRGSGNYWETVFSFGLISLVLAVWGVRKARDRPDIRGWLALAVLSGLFAFGRYFLVFDLLYAIAPGMSSFRVPARALFLTTMAVAMLAGYGVDAMGRPRVAAAIGLVAIGELVLYGFAMIQVASPSQFLGPDPVGRAIVAHQPDVPFRVRTRDAFYGDAPAFAIGLEKTNLNDAFQIRRAADLYERLYPMFGAAMPSRFPERFRPEIQAAVLDRMNVSLVVSDRDDASLGWPIVAEGDWRNDRFTIRRNPNFLPRAYVVPRARILVDGPAMVDRFVDHDPREEVLMSRDVLADSTERQPYTPASYRSLGTDRVEILVATEASGFLVVADTWMPGWSAELDGRVVTIHLGNHAQRVVVLDAPGSHRVLMRYTPPGLMFGRAVTLASLALWLVSILRGRVMENRARSCPR